MIRKESSQVLSKAEGGFGKKSGDGLEFQSRALQRKRSGVLGPLVCSRFLILMKWKLNQEENPAMSACIQYTHKHLLGGVCDTSSSCMRICKRCFPCCHYTAPGPFKDQKRQPAAYVNGADEQRGAQWRNCISHGFQLSLRSNDGISCCTQIMPPPASITTPLIVQIRDLVERVRCSAVI